MKALVFEGKVVQIEEEEFPVCAEMQWIECDNSIKPGHTFDGVTFYAPEPRPEREKSPSEIEIRLEALEAKIGITEADKLAARNRIKK